MTVEEYLKEQCKRRVDQLKEHMEGLVESFEVEAKKARTVLRDIASGSSAGADEAGACAPASFCDPFALVAIGGKFAGRVYKFEPNEVKSTWTIGRTENNDIGLTGDEEVSSSHAQISYEKKQFKLMDLGSTNGTFTSTQLVSAAKLKKKKNHVLKVGHIITFGACTFKWCVRMRCRARVPNPVALSPHRPCVPDAMCCQVLPRGSAHARRRTEAASYQVTRTAVRAVFGASERP